MALIPQSNGIPKNTNPPKLEVVKPAKTVADPVKSVEQFPTKPSQTKKQKYPKGD